MSSGNSWSMQCREEELGDKMEVEVDITKYKVQPFKSYKVCVSLDDASTLSFMSRVCTHLFSFERAVPYVPEVETVKEVTEKTVNKTLPSNREEENELQRVLEDTSDFVRDDFSEGESNLENIEKVFSPTSASIRMDATGMVWCLGTVLLYCHVMV